MSRSMEVQAGLSGVAVPDVFEGFGEGLALDGVVDVVGVAGEDELVVVSPGGQGLGHVLIGEDPVMHAIAHDVGIVEIAVADLQPDTDVLAGRVGDEPGVEVPGAAGHFGVPGPLLVDVGAGVSEDSAKPVGVKPGHDEGGGTAGASAHGGAAVGVASEADMAVGGDAGQDFMLDEVAVAAGDGVVFEAAFGALCVSAAILNGDGEDDGDAALCDEVIDGGEEEGVGSVLIDDEGSGVVGVVLAGDEDPDAAVPGMGMAGGDDEASRVVGVRMAEGSGSAGDAWIEAAVGGGHGEGADAALGEIGVREGSGRWGMGWTDDEVAVGGGRREGSIGEHIGSDHAGSVGVSDGDGMDDGAARTDGVNFGDALGWGVGGFGRLGWGLGGVLGLSESGAGEEERREGEVM